MFFIYIYVCGTEGTVLYGGYSAMHLVGALLQSCFVFCVWRLALGFWNCLESVVRLRVCSAQMG